MMENNEGVCQESTLPSGEGEGGKRGRERCIATKRLDIACPDDNWRPEQHERAGRGGAESK